MQRHGHHHFSLGIWFTKTAGEVRFKIFESPRITVVVEHARRAAPPERTVSP